MVKFFLYVCPVVSGFLVSCEGIIYMSTIFMHYFILAGEPQKMESNHSLVQISLCIRKPRNKTLGKSIAQM